MSTTLVGPNTAVGAPGGTYALLNVAASTVVKAVAGRCIRVSVVTAGSTAGTLNDCATIGAAAVANQFGTIPNTVGTYDFEWPCGTGIVVVTGTGQVVAVSYD